MSRYFNGPGHYLEQASAAATAAPLSMAIRYRNDNFNSNYRLVHLGASGSGNNSFFLEVLLTGAMTFTSRTTSSATATTSTTDTTAGTWKSAVGVELSSTSRAVYLNGGGKGTNTTSKTPSGVNTLRLSQSLSGTLPFQGYLADLAIWNAALTDGEAEAYGAGLSPLLIRPQSLVRYVPWLGRDSPEIDIVGGTTLTVTGATSSSQDPPVLWAPRRRIYIPSAAGGPYSASLTESLTAADAQASSGTHGATLTESLTQSDALATVATLARSLTESLTAADAQSSSLGGSTYAADLAESLTRSDAQSSAATLPGSLTESLTRSDSLASLATLIGSLAESLTASDAQTSSAGASTYDVTLTESLTRSDAQASAAVLAAALAEARSAADALASLGVLGVAVVDAVTVSELLTAGGQLEPGARVIRVRFESRTVYVDMSGRVIGIDPAPRIITPDRLN